MKKILKSLAGMLVALRTFFIVWPVSQAVYKLVSSARGEPGWWQFILTDLLAPGIGAWIGMLVVENYQNH